jgi:hypothetical protein
MLVVSGVAFVVVPFYFYGTTHHIKKILCSVLDMCRVSWIANKMQRVAMFMTRVSNFTAQTQYPLAIAIKPKLQKIVI